MLNANPTQLGGSKRSREKGGLTEPTSLAVMREQTIAHRQRWGESEMQRVHLAIVNSCFSCLARKSQSVFLGARATEFLHPSLVKGLLHFLLEIIW